MKTIQSFNETIQRIYSVKNNKLAKPIIIIIITQTRIILAFGGSTTSNGGLFVMILLPSAEYIVCISFVCFFSFVC